MTKGSILIKSMCIKLACTILLCSGARTMDNKMDSDNDLRFNNAHHDVRRNFGINSILMGISFKSQSHNKSLYFNPVLLCGGILASDDKEEGNKWQTFLFVMGNKNCWAFTLSNKNYVSDILRNINLLQQKFEQAPFNKNENARNNNMNNNNNVPGSVNINITIENLNIYTGNNAQEHLDNERLENKNNAALPNHLIEEFLNLMRNRTSRVILMRGNEWQSILFLIDNKNCCGFTVRKKNYIWDVLRNINLFQNQFEEVSLNKKGNIRNDDMNNNDNVPENLNANIIIENANVHAVNNELVRRPVMAHNNVVVPQHLEQQFRNLEQRGGYYISYIKGEFRLLKKN